MPELPHVTIAIPTYHREKWLRETPAQKHGAPVHNREWTSFHDSINEAFDPAAQPSGLRLDADEEVSSTFLTYIETSFSRSDDQRFAETKFSSDV